MLNFDPDDNKVNESALEEMVSVSLESLFSWQHPLIEMNCRSMCLFNIRFWNGHLEHFLSYKICSTYFSLSYFTEANISNSPSKHIDEILDDWEDIHKNTQHGLALCYDVSKVNIEITENWNNWNNCVFEVLPVVLEIEKKALLLVIVYRMPSLLGTVIDDFILLINELSTQHLILIVGDFNLDQMLPTDPSIEIFNMFLGLHHLTHMYGGFKVLFLRL